MDICYKVELPSLIVFIFNKKTVFAFARLLVID